MVNLKQVLTGHRGAMPKLLAKIQDSIQFNDSTHRYTVSRLLKSAMSSVITPDAVSFAVVYDGCPRDYFTLMNYETDNIEFA